MNNNKSILYTGSLFLLCGLMACSGGNSSSNSDGAKQAPARLHGQVAHGVASDAIVRAVRADTGEELATTHTDKDGSFQLTLNYNGPVLLTAEPDENTLLHCDSLLPEGCGDFPRASGGDTNQNGIVDFGEAHQPGQGHFQLHSFVPSPQSGSSTPIAISPLTHATWALAQRSGQLSEAGFKRVQSQINNLFGMESDHSHGTLAPRTSILTAEDRNRIAHSALATALNSWAYLQPEGYQQALERFAEVIANNQLPGQLSDPRQLSLSAIMKLAEIALQRTTHEYPGWPIADLIARFGILQHIGADHGANPVPLPDPDTDHPASNQERLAKGKRLVADLRSWAYSLMEELDTSNDKYSTRLNGLEQLANILEQQHSLLKDAHRLFEMPSNRLFERIWSDLYPCLAAGAMALQANKILWQPSRCPYLNLSGNQVELQGQLLNSHGLVISDITTLKIERLNADHSGETELYFSGKLTDQNAGISLTIASARWHYRLKPGQSELSDDWNTAQDQLQSSSLESTITLADQHPPEHQTRYQGSWHLSLDAGNNSPPSTHGMAEGTLYSPRGTLRGIFSGELQSYSKAEKHKNGLRRASLVFQGTLQSLSGEIMTGTIWLDSDEVNALDDVRPLSLSFEGQLESLTGSTFEGSLKLLSDAKYYDKPATLSDWFGWWHTEQLGKSVTSGLKLLDFSGKVTTATDEYLLLRAYLHIHNPGNLISSELVREWNLGSWEDMLDGNPQQFPRFSATLLFEEGIPGREKSWVSLSLDRTGYREAAAELRLSSNLASDWRSMTLRYDYMGSQENPIQLFSFINQNGAKLKLDVACEVPSDQPLRNCKAPLKNLKGSLLVEGEKVGQLQLLGNRLVKVTYSDGQFETLQ